MDSHRQPLLSSLRKSAPSCKTLFLTLSLITLFYLVILIPHLVNTNNNLHVCKHASDPSSCISIVSKHSVAGIFPRTHVDLLQILLKESIFHADNAAFLAAESRRKTSCSKQQAALANCVDLMDISLERLNDCASGVNLLRARSTGAIAVADDVYVWLAGVLANHVTCVDGLSSAGTPALEAQLGTLIDLGRTSLAVFSSISPATAEQLQPRRPGDFPSWLSGGDRTVVRARPGEIKADVVVAKDGSGDYVSIQEAVAKAPENSEVRFVIHVKKGRYEEKVVVGRKKRNLVIMGDGMDSTIVAASLSVADGSSVFNSATFVALGDGFMAQDIWFQNTARPEKHQAVALLIAADQSVINRCRIDGHHNTLWAHSLRQLYRNCVISGTKDFIFGNAISVLQNCRLITLEETISN